MTRRERKLSTRTCCLHVAVILGALAVLGCAAGPLPPARDLQPGDLSRLAGTWLWTAPFESPARLGSGPIKIRLAEGRMLFESASAVGTLRFHEDGTRRVLDGEGQDRVGGGRFAVQLTQRTSADGRPRAESAPDTALVLVITE